MTRIHPRLLLVGAALALALAVAAMPTSTAQGNSGTIKVHDGAGADPDERNEPHVLGDVYVEGFNMAAEGGDLLFYSWPPTGDMELVLATTWEADDGTPAFHFLAGPYELACGHYRVFAYNGDGPEDPAVPDEGQAKKKAFWVDCGEGSDYECPTDLAVVANADETVTLTFTPATGSDGTNVYRAEGDGDLEYLLTVPANVTEVVDDTTQAGITYTYMVTALFGDEESQSCAMAEATAIPVFPGAIGLGLASALGVGLYLAVGRRKA